MSGFLKQAIDREMPKLKKIMKGVDLYAPTTYSLQDKALSQAIAKSLNENGLTYQEALDTMKELMKTIDRNISIDITPGKSRR